jgi:hypothetical protein
MDAGTATLMTFGAAALLVSWVLLLIVSWKEDYAWGLCTLFLPPLLRAGAAGQGRPVHPGGRGGLDTDLAGLAVI